jgi:hypothetical protein
MTRHAFFRPILITLLSAFLTAYSCADADTATTQPTTDNPVQSANEAMIRATDALESAKSAALDKFHSSAKYKAEKVDLDVKANALAAARANGNIQSRLDASSAYNLIRVDIEKQEAAIAKNDPSIALAAEGVERARGGLEIAKADRKAAADAKKAEEDAEDAIRKATENIEREKLAEAAIPEITATQLDTLGERYANKRVKITFARFTRADNNWVDFLPGVTISSNGLQSMINVDEKRKWIGFVARDTKGEYFDRIFASKDTYGDLLAGLDSGSVISLRGTAVMLPRTGGDYGIICDKVVVEKPPAPPP